MKPLTYVCLLLVCLASYAQEKYAATNGAIMIDGFDPVSYFEGNPQKGNPEINTRREGRIYLFATVRNKDKFLEKPHKYEPAYGGWCAIAMVDGSFVIPDYELFKIQEDKLHFFSVRAFYNGLTEWNRKPDLNKVKADQNYRKYFPD